MSGDRLAAVEAPVLVLQGDRSWDGSELDTSVDPSLVLIRRAIAGVEVVTLHAHPVHLTLQEPDQASDRVTEFLAAHPL